MMQLAGFVCKAAVATLAAMVLVSTQPAWAQPASDWKPNALEVQELPAYCQGQFRKELGNVAGYTKPPSCGEWFNHFCPALVSLNRASKYSAPKKERQYALQSANGHLKYTRAHLTPTCTLVKDLELAEMRARMLAVGLK